MLWKVGWVKSRFWRNWKIIQSWKLSKEIVVEFRKKIEVRTHHWLDKGPDKDYTWVDIIKDSWRKCQ